MRIVNRFKLSSYEFKKNEKILDNTMFTCYNLNEFKKSLESYLLENIATYEKKLIKNTRSGGWGESELTLSPHSPTVFIKRGGRFQ